MSMHFAVASLEGDRLAELDEVLKKCGYAIEGSTTVRTADQASSQMVKFSDGTHVGKAAYFANGWTFIADPGLLLMSNKVWLHYSKKWKARIVGWLCEGTSATYGLALYESGKKRREIVSVDGNVVMEEGKPLPEESNVDWSEATEETILDLAKRLGAKYEFPAKAAYKVYKLSSSSEE